MLLHDKSSTDRSEVSFRYRTGSYCEVEFLVLFRYELSKWSKIDVPSCWEQQGFGGYTYGRYYIYKEHEKEKQYDAYREHDFAMNTASIVIVLMFRTLGKANR